MKAYVAACSAAVVVFLASTRRAEADFIGNLFHADTMAWTVLVFVIGMLAGAVAIHLLRKKRGR